MNQKLQKAPNRKILGLIRQGKVKIVAERVTCSDGARITVKKDCLEMSSERKGMPKKFTLEEITPEQKG